MANDPAITGSRPAADPRRLPVLEKDSNDAAQRGLLVDALPPRRELLSLLQSLYGPENPKMVPHLRELARYQEKMGFPVEAEKSTSLSLRINEKTPMESSPDIARDLFQLATGAIRRRRFPDAESHLTRGLKLIRILYGDGHPVTARAWTLWGDYYAETGHFDEAGRSYDKSVDIWGRQPPAEAAEQLDTVSRQARVARLQGRLEKAESLLTDVLARREKAVGRNDPRAASDGLNLARFYNERQLFRKSLPLLVRALELRTTLFGADHPETAEVLAASGDAQGLQGDVMQAEDFYQRALRVYEKCYGPQSPDLAGCLNDLAGLYYDHGHGQDSEPVMRRSLDIMKKVYDPAHPEVSTGTHNLAACLEALGRQAEADALRRQPGQPVRSAA